MSFLKNILGAFVEFNEQTQDNKKPSQTESTTASTTGIPKTSTVAPADTVNNRQATSSSATANQYQKHFEDLIEEANNKNPLFQGTDFKEFIDSKIDVEGIADEGLRYKTTFNVLKRTGLTKEKLLTTGQEYMNVIDLDVKAFETVFAGQYKNQVEQKEQLMQQKAQELQLLTQKIELLNKEVKQITEEVTATRERLNTNKNLFISAAENKKAEIETELKKINQYFS